MRTIKLLFGMEERVSRKSYIVWGFSLMLVKYLGEVTLYYLAKGTLLAPLQYLSPMLSTRYPGFSAAPDWFFVTFIFWSLPFIWIGVGMSIRRAADADYSPWLGILFFIPVVNYFLMLALSLAPTSNSSKWGEENVNADSLKIISPLVISAGSAFFGTIIIWLSTNIFGDYAASLFIGTPLLFGLIQGYLLNFRESRTLWKTLGYVGLSMFCIHLFLLLFALEGVICLAMSLPICGGMAIIGAFFGTAIARYGKTPTLTPTVLVIALPLMPLIENQVIQPYQDIVLSTIEINASPEQVWPNVVKFSDLPPTNDWLFKLGVAHPLRARIDGQGVGAIRHCEFSTGAFVEPITIWNEPNQLAFDVRYQPQPMKELSFYDHVDAPHLNGYFRSVKGEFKLIPLANGRTRLEGRTWYEMDMHPGSYWQIYGRWFIHKIHLRVLAHVKNLSEAPAALN